MLSILHRHFDTFGVQVSRWNPDRAVAQRGNIRLHVVHHVEDHLRGRSFCHVDLVVDKRCIDAPRTEDA